MPLSVTRIVPTLNHRVFSLPSIFTCFLVQTCRYRIALWVRLCNGSTYALKGDVLWNEGLDKHNATFRLFSLIVRHSELQKIYAVHIRSSLNKTSVDNTALGSPLNICSLYNV